MSVRRQIASIPAWHWFVAFLLAALGGGAAYWGWHQIPTEYTAISVLSYEDPTRFLADKPSASFSTVSIANSILTSDRLETIARDAGFESGDGGALADEFRPNMNLDEPGPGLLQVTVQASKKQVSLAAAHGITSALAVYQPTSASQSLAVPAADKLPPEELRRQMQLAGAAFADFRQQRESLDQRIADLVAKQPPPSTQTSQLAALEKQREIARAKEKAASASYVELKRELSSPAVAVKSLPVADTSLAPAGRFTVIAWPDGPHPVPNQQQFFVSWGGLIGAPLLALGYMVLIFLRYRPIKDSEHLRKVLPAGARYLGSVVGGPLKGDSR